MLLTSVSENVLRVTTAADGSYNFDGLLAGLYTVTVDAATAPPALNLLTTPYPMVVSLHDGEGYRGADVGLKGLSALVGDTIWYDANANGRQDAGEPGIGNVTLDLYRDNGDGVFDPGIDLQVDSTTSDAVGAYRLLTPVDGVYFVDVSDRRGLLTGFAHPVGPQSLTAPSPAITLTVGQTHSAADFGYIRTPQAGQALIGDLAWADADGDGVRESHEPVLAGVTICATPVGGGTPICTATDGNGRYLLETPAGAYNVAPNPGPVGLQGSTPNQLAVNSGGQPAAFDCGLWLQRRRGDFRRDRRHGLATTYQPMGRQTAFMIRRRSRASLASAWA